MEDKYKSYSVPELAGEDAFIRWVIKGENDLQWSVWQQSNPNQVSVIAKARQLVHEASGLEVKTISSSEKNELWNRISGTVQHASQPAPPKIFSLVRWSMAAAAMLAFLIWMNNTGSSEKVIAHAGEKKEIILPESSLITLNAGSRVKYHEKKFQDQRELTLEGEAFFEVNPGSTFTVRTDQGSIAVLGTSFNVIAREGRFEVSCHTGKVSVTYQDNEKQIIGAGEKITGDNEQLRKETFATIVKPQWMEGKFTFDNQPLAVVLDELERQYNIKVDISKELQEIRYTGLFEAGNLQEALDMVTWPRHLQYTIKGKSVTISR